MLQFLLRGCKTAYVRPKIIITVPVLCVARMLKLFASRKENPYIEPIVQTMQKWVQLINENETSQYEVRRGILSLASRLLSVQEIRSKLDDCLVLEIGRVFFYSSLKLGLI